MTGLPPGTRVRVVANVIGRQGSLGTVVVTPRLLESAGWDVSVQLDEFPPDDDDPDWPLGFDRHELEVVDEP